MSPSIPFQEIRDRERMFFVDTWGSNKLPRYQEKINTEYDLWSDNRRKYRGNNCGYRSDDFIGAADLVITGCSVTYGSGLDEDQRWGNMIASKLGIESVASLAEAGHAINALVENLFRYFKEFGNPKTVLCLFPSFGRINIAVDNLVNKLPDDFSDNYGGSNHGVVTTIDTGYYGQLHDSSKYDKKPYDISKVFSYQQAKMINASSIRHLEDYCNSNNIKLLWSTWHPDSASTIENQVQQNELTKFNNYISVTKDRGYSYLKASEKGVRYVFTKDDLKMFSNCQGLHSTIECDCDLINCHEEEKLTYKDVLEFDHATDDADGLGHIHPGIHSHIHFLEAFLEHL